MMDHRARAEEASRTGRYEDAIREHLCALEDPQLDDEDRTHELANLATSYERARKWDLAERTAREALVIASRADSPRAEAHARLTFGMVLFQMFRDGIASSATGHVL